MSFVSPLRRRSASMVNARQMAARATSTSPSAAECASVFERRCMLQRPAATYTCYANLGLI